jgi:hypothetical protein
MKKLRIIRTLLIGAVMAPLAITSAGTSAHASSTTSGVIKGYQNLKCLDEDTHQPGRLQLWQCSGASEQRWTRIIGSAFTSDTGQFVNVDMLKNSRTGKCVTATVGDPLNISVTDEPCQTFPSSPQQTWEEIFSVIDSGGHRYAVLRNQENHKCLAHATTSTDGTRVAWTECDFRAALYWYLP